MLHRHRRQGLPATDHRPRRRLQHPQGRGVRRGGARARIGASGRTRSSIFRRWWATRSTTCRACRRSGRRRPRPGSKRTARSTICWTTPPKFPGPKGKKLAEGREMALLSRELVRLDDNVPIVPDWNASRVGGFDHQRLAELFAEFGFRSLGERFAKLGGATAGDRARRLGRRLPHRRHAGQARRAGATLCRSRSLISVDTETTHIMPRWAEIVGYSFAWQPGEAFYVPVRGPAGETVLDPAATLDSAAARPRKPRHRQDRPEPQVRHDRAPHRRRRAGRRGVRHDGRQLPARRRRAEPQSRRPGQPLSQPHDDQDQRADRQGQEPEADGRGAGRPGRPLRGRGCRRAAAAQAAARSPARRNGPRPSSTKRSKCR